MAWAAWAVPPGLKKGESAREDPWYEQPRITKLPTIHSDRAD